ncbi:MAG: hypothetical protein ACYTFT_13045 [Planctomycetota bacterium]|jgi:hypothetical protein
MSGTFGSEKKGGGGGGAGGGDYIRDAFPATYGEYLAGKTENESTTNKYVTWDNTIGEVTLRVPPQYNAYRNDLLMEMYEKYYGEPAGDPKVLEAMNLWVGEWLENKAKEGT